VHVQNNNAFPILSKSEKSIEVSHWGNIAISYFNKLYNDGAKLKGEFGRVSYSRNNPNNGKNAVK
jgi:oligosaccharyltransferase complex subunit alpha (ribophorin I)